MTLDPNEMIFLFGKGLLAVTLIDTLGSITSRRLNYKYQYLAPISLLVYFLVGYQGFQIVTLAWTLIIACLIGIYDATVGWQLAIILRANFAEMAEDAKNIGISTLILRMLTISGLFGFFGFVVAGLVK